MRSKQVIVPNRLGVHARPSARIAKMAGRFHSKVTLIKGENEGDAKSIMAVMLLAMQRGEIVEIKTEGHDEVDALEAIASLFEHGFGEESVQ